MTDVREHRPLIVVGRIQMYMQVKGGTFARKHEPNEREGIRWHTLPDHYSDACLRGLVCTNAEALVHAHLALEDCALRFCWNTFARRDGGSIVAMQRP